MEREPEAIWTRLRRRKVVQWGAVYGAAAWGFLQGLEYISESFSWPQQVRQIAVLVLVIGLPIVLVLAWYHGDRGQQRVSTPEFAILTLLLLLGGGAFWYYQRSSEAAKDAASTASAVQPDASPGIKDARPSVAVLPFENRSREADDAFFVDGIHDDILTQLSKVSALRVISRTSVEQFRDTKLTMKAIGDQLGVTKILEGGVQRGGDRVRVTVQLIDAATDAHLWAENYDRELTAANIFDIQSEVATAIAAALKTALSPAEQSRVATVPTHNLDAWEAYQLGKQRMAKRTSARLKEAEQFFRKAIALDPKFALAYAALSDAVRLQLFYAGRPLQEVIPEAERAAVKALELDPNLAEAWASRGENAGYQGDPARAEEMLRKAVELDPNYAPARHWLGQWLAGEGKLDEALGQLEKAVALDPLSAIIKTALGSMQQASGRFEAAAQSYRRAIEIDPSMAVAYAALANMHVYVWNRYADAVPLMERAISLDPGNSANVVDLAVMYLDIGDMARATTLLDEAKTRWPDDSYVHATAAAFGQLTGDDEAAERNARKALADDPKYAFAMNILRDADLARSDHTSARARYASAYPELFRPQGPKIDPPNGFVAINVVPVLQRTGETELAAALLKGSEQVIRIVPRLGGGGYGILDVSIHALRNDKVKALAALREAEKAGWRSGWVYVRDVELTLASIRNEPEFKAIFADIERDMAQQRARLAARPKDAPLELSATTH